MTTPSSEPRFAGTPVPTPPISDDDGSASADLVAHLVGVAAGTSTGEQVLAALSGARLLVPVVAILEESQVEADGLRREKSSSMASILVANDTGGRALLAFSSTTALSQWRSDARPVPIAAPLAARAAIDEGADTLLIDIAGPAPFAVAGRELLLIAAVSRQPGSASDDPVLLEALRHHLTPIHQVKGASLARSAASDPESSADVEEALPGVLTLVATDDDRSWLPDLVARVARDRVIARLAPEGLRVRVMTDSAAQDTPRTLPGSDAGL